MSGSLPTEKHGDERKAFIDLKFETLLELSEIDDFLRTPGDDHPSQYIFDLKEPGHALNLPDIDMAGPLRKDIKGQLVMKVGRQELEFEDAHTVGAVNKLTFMTGGKGKLTVQLRMSPGAAEYTYLVEAIERGECSIRFEEYKDSANGKGKNEKQSEMGV